MKNRLHEQKAWASSATAKTMQAQFICMTHHLMTLLEAQIMAEEGIRNEAEQKRRRARIIKQVKKTRAAGHGKLPFAQRLVQKITQRSVKFVRWLRVFLFSPASWSRACANLTQLYETDQNLGHRCIFTSLYYFFSPGKTFDLIALPQIAGVRISPPNSKRFLPESNKSQLKRSSLSVQYLPYFPTKFQEEPSDTVRTPCPNGYFPNAKVFEFISH